MFAALVSVALLAISANGLVVPARRADDASSCTAPATYAQGFLEDYCSYHERYVTLGCRDQHNSTFFDNCCHPMLASENLNDNRASYCVPSTSSTAAFSEATDSEPAYTPDPTTSYAPETTYVPETTSTYEAPSETYTPESTSEYVPESTSEYVPEYTPEATTSSEAPAETTSSSDSGSSSGGSTSGSGYSGTATFFYQNGVAGACGTVHSDDDYVVAIPYSLWGSGDYLSSNCGKTVTLVNDNTGSSVTATVADLCPTCVGTYSIDLSKGAFLALAQESDGVFPITYYLN
ncbi:hypothetical protein BDZ89DRAFT_1107375 [Hymenopellis radicata]|nr:hypothetical protein BDZ89DRAFT_1107375 [Hymenopellis radicata]